MFAVFLAVLTLISFVCVAALSETRDYDLNSSDSNTFPVLVPPDRPRERSAIDEQFHYRALNAAHDAMITAPKAMTELLLEALDVV